MKIREILQIAAVLALIALISTTSGCIFDPKEAVDEDSVPVVEWPDRTNKEDCITIISRVYNEAGVSIEKYKEVLLPPGVLQEEKLAAGYIWYNQTEDEELHGASLSYEEDWNGTQGILEEAVSIDITMFSYPPVAEGEWSGNWEKIPEIRGVAGPNFWSTKRNYLFDFTFEKPFHGDYDVIFTIGPDPADSSKYVIYQAKDIGKGWGVSDTDILSRETGFTIHDNFILRDKEDSKRQPVSSEQTSWGEVKSMYK